MQSPSGFEFAATPAHVPLLPPVFAALHALQVPVQAVSQQKPSTQPPALAQAWQPTTLQSAPAATLHEAPCDFLARHCPFAAQ